MTFQRFEAIAGALVAALVLAALGAYVLYTFHTTAGLAVGVVCILLALMIVVPVQIKAGAKNMKDAGKDVHDAIVVVVPTVVDAVMDGERHTDPQSTGGGT